MNEYRKRPVRPLFQNDFHAGQKELQELSEKGMQFQQDAQQQLLICLVFYMALVSLLVLSTMY